MYLHFSNSLLLLLLPFRLVVWHSLASMKLVAKSSPPFCGSLLHSERHWLITQWHTQHWRKMFPFPPARERRVCAAAGRREREWEIERDQVELRCIKQHCRVASSAVCTKRNGNWNANTNTHTHSNCTATLSCGALFDCTASLACTCCLLSKRHAHTHTHARRLFLSAVYKMMWVGGGGKGKRTFGVLIIKFVAFLRWLRRNSAHKIVVEYLLYAYYYCCLFRLLRTMGVVIVVVVVAPVFALLFLFLFCCRVLCFHTQHSFDSLFCLLLRWSRSLLIALLASLPAVSVVVLGLLLLLFLY